MASFIRLSVVPCARPRIRPDCQSISWGWLCSSLGTWSATADFVHYASRIASLCSLQRVSNNLIDSPMYSSSHVLHLIEKIAWVAEHRGSESFSVMQFLQSVWSSKRASYVRLSHSSSLIPPGAQSVDERQFDACYSFVFVGRPSWSFASANLSPDNLVNRRHFLLYPFFTMMIRIVSSSRSRMAFELQSNLTKATTWKLRTRNFSPFNLWIQMYGVRSWNCDHLKNANCRHRRSAQSVDLTCEKRPHTSDSAKNTFRSSNFSFAGTPNERSQRLQAPLGMVVANYAPAYTCRLPIADVAGSCKGTCKTLYWKFLNLTWQMRPLEK